MKKLRWKSFLATFPTMLVLAILAAISLTIAIICFSLMAKGPQDLETVDFSTDVDGLYVTGTVYGVYDIYCENYSAKTLRHRVERLISLEYVASVDATHYIGLYTLVGKRDKPDNLMYATQDYLNGISDGTALAKAQYEITGTIKKMPADSLQHYYETIGYYSMDPETQSLFLPYYISVGNVGITTKPVSIICAVLGGIMVLIIAFMLGKNLTGAYQASIRQYIKYTANPLVAQEKVEKFLTHAPNNNNFQYDADFICGQHGGTTAFATTKSVVLAYLHTDYVKGKAYYSIGLGLINGTLQYISAQNEMVARAHLETIRNLCPQAIICFSDEYNSMFNNNLLGFLNLRYNKVVRTNETFTNNFDEI